MIKIQRNSKKIHTTIWLLPCYSERAERPSHSSKIEKLLLRCVIILILKIHYSTTEEKKFSSYAEYIPTVHCCRTAFKRLYTPNDKENLIWNKSRNTFFIADNSNALSLSLTFSFRGSGCVWNYTEKNNAHLLWCYSEAWCW
jgi:hypothetical protein